MAEVRFFLYVFFFLYRIERYRYRIEDKVVVSGSVSVQKKWYRHIPSFNVLRFIVNALHSLFVGYTICGLYHGQGRTGHPTYRAYARWAARYWGLFGAFWGPKMHQNVLKCLWRITRPPATAGRRAIRQRGISGRFGAF